MVIGKFEVLLKGKDKGKENIALKQTPGNPNISYTSLYLFETVETICQIQQSCLPDSYGDLKLKLNKM